jgi:galactose-1-phosphate uridylyltransferase
MKKNTLKEVKVNDLRKVIEIWEDTYKKLIEAKKQQI